MSLINKMLRELDKRHAAPGTAAPPTVPQAAPIAPPPPPIQTMQTVRAVKGARVGSELFWWSMAVVMGAAIAWIGWVMWQLSPRSIVNEVALRPFSVAPAANQGAVPPAQVATVPAPAPLPDIAAPAEALPAEEEHPRVDMLKLATEITTPILVRPKPASASPAKPAGEPAATAKAATSPAPAVAAVPPVDRLLPPSLVKPAPSASASQDNSRIDKRTPGTPRDRAESEYRRAVSLVNQGRVSEGMDALRGALQIDPSHEPARQTLVALLVEQRRLEDSVTVLQEGLNLRPSNSDFAMLLARILVDRQDVSGSLAVLQKYAPTAGTKADYHGFAAALHQRLGQHREAIEEYQTALRLSPQSGVWWVGLGISQEAAERRKDALDSFRRARASGLNGELLAYVDQRLRQLQ